jgi:hypothetical protein
MLDLVDRRRSDLAQVVRRNFGGHADGDSRSAVEQQERQARRQERRFVEGSVVVGQEVDRAFAEFAEQQFGDRVSGALPCSASPRRCRHHANRNCPARRPADSAA